MRLSKRYYCSLQISTRFYREKAVYVRFKTCKEENIPCIIVRNIYMSFSLLNAWDTFIFNFSSLLLFLKAKCECTDLRSILSACIYNSLIKWKSSCMVVIFLKRLLKNCFSKSDISKRSDQYYHASWITTTIITLTRSWWRNINDFKQFCGQCEWQSNAFEFNLENIQDGRWKGAHDTSNLHLKQSTVVIFIYIHINIYKYKPIYTNIPAKLKDILNFCYVSKVWVLLNTPKYSLLILQEHL